MHIVPLKRNTVTLGEVSWLLWVHVSSPVRWKIETNSAKLQWAFKHQFIETDVHNNECKGMQDFQW